MPSTELGSIEPARDAGAPGAPRVETVEVILVDLPTIRPHQLSMTTMRRQTLVLLRLRCSDGVGGIGEGTTIGGLSYGNESPEGIKLAIDTYLAPALRGRDARRPAAVAREVRRSHIAKCAVETALLHAWGRREGVPLSELLGGRVRDRLPVAWTLASGDTARDVEEAEAMLDGRRHRVFKLEIGAHDPNADVAYVAAIKRALGDRASVRVDVNQTWDESTAMRGIAAVAEAGVDLVEQPVPRRNRPALARLDDGTDVGETLYMHGRLLTIDGRPIPGAIVDVWHADTLGRYSFFDPSQTPYVLRRRIETDAGGRYRCRSIMPAGYGCPLDGPTQRRLSLLGRHGQRPAHIHFFASAPGLRQLTTQINIAGDPLVHGDFAFATREELIPDVVRHDRPTPDAHATGIEGPFAEIEFDFVLHEAGPDLPPDIVNRERVSATA